MSSESRVSVTLLELPEGALLKVLKLLPVEDLLTCRLACKRLGNLALHQGVWCHRTLSAAESRSSGVLRLAPCLKELTVSERTLLPHLFDTSCAVEKLTLKVPRVHMGAKWGDFNATAAEKFYQVFCRQKALGRLKHIDIFLPFLSQAARSADALTKTLVAASSSMESLSLAGEGVELAKKSKLPVPLAPRGPSLKRFKFLLKENTQCFVRAVLAGHATSLECVEIRLGAVNLGKISSNLNIPRLLATMPKLRKLKCPWRYGMEALAACESLTDLSLEDHEDPFTDPAAVDRAADLLRRATQLRSLSIGVNNTHRVSPKVDVVKLIDALAVPGRPLANLSVIGNSAVLVPALCRALPALSHLSVLLLSESDGRMEEGVADELLQAVRESAPSLQLLELETLSWRNKDGDCAHAWFHRESVRTTMVANTSLHLVRSLPRLDTYEGVVYCGVEDTDFSDEEDENGEKVEKDEGDGKDLCEFCARGCHSEMVGAEAIGLYSHGIQCPAPDLHVHSESPGLRRRDHGLLPKMWFKL